MRYKNSWMEATVIDIRDVADNVRQIMIKPLGGTIPFTVGAHIDISVLVKNLPEIRSYSLVGRWQPGQAYTVAVKLLPNSRGGSAAMWSLQKGDRLKISAPTNHFELSHTREQYLLVAGGIGITPLIGMAEELVQARKVDVFMIYVGKRASEMPFIERLQGLLGDRLLLHFSEEQGRFDFNRLFDFVSSTSLVYLCGPIGFMNAVRKLWEESDHKDLHLRYETFGASGLFAPQDFKVKLPRLKREVEVAANQSLLQALSAANIEVMYDCQKGECGLCQVDIIEYSGDIDHRDCFFSEQQKGENKKMCACVSRVANGELVIDTAFRG